MRKLMIGLAVVAMTASPAAAQRIENYGLEVRPFFGAYVPFTAQRDAFKDAITVGAQAAYEMNDYFHAVSSFGWTQSKYRLPVNKSNTDILHYDIGLEANALYDLSADWLWRPFLGVGGGGRSYLYSGTGVKNTTCTAGYGAIGTEFQRGAIAIRAEARDYLNCYKVPATGQKKTRNDGLFMFGMAYHVR